MTRGASNVSRAVLSLFLRELESCAPPSTFLTTSFGSTAGKLRLMGRFSTGSASKLPSSPAIPSCPASSRAFSSEAASTSAKAAPSPAGAEATMVEPGFVGHKPMSSKNLPVERGPVTWGSLLATVLLGSAVLYKFKEDRDAKVEKYRNEGAMGKAAIGGPFRLTGHDGKPFDSAELKGQFHIIYFGFTQCPDACPEALYKLADSLQLLGKEGINITPVFITVDPERDNVNEVAAYVHDFHKGMIGLTGGVQEVKDVARKFRVYYNKVQEDGPNDYLVDHTIIQYLMDPEGDFVTFYAKNSSAEDMYKSIKELVEEYEKKHPEYDRRKVQARTQEFSEAAEREAIRATQLRRQRQGWFGWLTGRK